MFRLMPPMRHDADPTRSEVVTYIRENLRCELGRALRAFDSMRHMKSAVLIFDRIHRQWRGCDWVPAEEVDKVSMLLAMITEMKRDISSLRSELRKVKGEVVWLRRRKGGRKTEDVADSDDEAQEEKSSPDVDSEELEERAKEENFRKLQEATKDPAFWDNLPSYHSVPSTEPLSSPSGSTAPTQSRWENAEDEVS